jgi:hypothetical protein
LKEVDMANTTVGNDGFMGILIDNIGDTYIHNCISSSILVISLLKIVVLWDTNRDKMESITITNYMKLPGDSKHVVRAVLQTMGIQKLFKSYIVSCIPIMDVTCVAYGYDFWCKLWTFKHPTTFLMVGGFNPSEKSEFVSWDYDIPNMMGKS